MSEELDLNSLPLVQALAQSGSFTAAAERLGCSKTKISLQLKALEQQLGVALFRRTTRKLSLTSSGEQLLQQCMPLLELLQEQLVILQQDDRQLQGRLVISAPEDYTARVLVPVVLAFRQLQPGVDIELRSSDQVRDMIKEGIDLSVRVGWLQDSSQIAQRLGGFAQRLLAAPDYFARRGTPHTPAELSGHDFIAFTQLKSPLHWVLTHKQQQKQQQISFKAAYATGSTHTVTALLKAGAGLGVMTDYSAAPLVASGQLVAVLPDWHLPAGGIYVVYPPGSQRPARVRAFVDFLRQHLPGTS